VNTTTRAAARAELALFLRNRRARVQPTDVGFAEGPRRRTPGLRREEVAQLAEVGLSWYTWLEQGRDIHVSEPFLERLAVALRLTAPERRHLFELAQGRPAAQPVLAQATVSGALQRVLDAHPFPGLVWTPRWDVLAWNRPAALLFGDFALLPAAERNGLWQTFTNPERRTRNSNWEAAVRQAVARFRLDAARAANRAEFDALAAELGKVSPEFARFWAEHDVVDTSEGLKALLDSTVGEITFEYVTLAHLEPDGRTLRVTLYTPEPGKSAARARKLFRGITG
jgi:transcriptional regulator with XRE-family HTH domain